jgi:hypothetical protein
MANCYFTGSAQAVAQVTTVTVGGTLSGETFNILVNGEICATHTDSTTVIADTVAGLVSTWNASTNPYASHITAADTSPSLTLTSDVAGLPFTITLNDPGSPATLGQAATTANAGPHCWDSAANWSNGAEPVASDNVYIGNTDVNICWGLDNNAVTLSNLRIADTYRGRIGLDPHRFAVTADGETYSDDAAADGGDDQYKEDYREDYLRLGWDRADIGESQGPAPDSSFTRLKLDNTKSGASVTAVHKVISEADEDGACTVRLKTAHASATVYVRSAAGGVGIAWDDPSETSTVGDVHLTGSANTDRLQIGHGTTITNYYQTGGLGYLRAANNPTDVTVDGGTLYTEGDFKIDGTLTLGRDDKKLLLHLPKHDPLVYANHIKTGDNAIDAADVNRGTLDGTQSREARTWDTVRIKPGATGKLQVDQDVVTITALSKE